MGMSTGGGDDGHGAPMSEINTTPLVDVMLVLLIIFMITAPLMSSKVPLDLPTATYEEEPETDAGTARVTLSIQDVDGVPQYYWDDEKIQWQGLVDRMRLAAGRSPQPEMKVRADRVVKYKAVSEVLQEAKKIGVLKVAFITTPDQK